MKDSEAVRLWRDTFRLNLSASWKRDVDITVTDIELWKSILAGWKWRDAEGRWHNKHPGIKGLLTEYERLEMTQREAQRKKDEIQRAKDLRERSQQGVSTRSVSPMFNLRRGANGWKG